MKDRLAYHIDLLLSEDDLPDTTMEQSALFIRTGDLRRLTELPLKPEAMIEVGHVLMHATANSRYAPGSEPVPVLSDPVRLQLRALVDEEGKHTDAALFVLSQDLRARAWNRTLAE